MARWAIVRYDALRLASRLRATILLAGAGTLGFLIPAPELGSPLFVVWVIGTFVCAGAIALSGGVLIREIWGREVTDDTARWLYARPTPWATIAGSRALETGVVIGAVVVLVFTSFLWELLGALTASLAALIIAHLVWSSVRGLPETDDHLSFAWVALVVGYFFVMAAAGTWHPAWVWRLIAVATLGVAVVSFVATYFVVRRCPLDPDRRQRFVRHRILPATLVALLPLGFPLLDPASFGAAEQRELGRFGSSYVRLVRSAAMHPSRLIVQVRAERDSEWETIGEANAMACCGPARSPDRRRLVVPLLEEGVPQRAEVGPAQAWLSLSETVPPTELRFGEMSDRPVRPVGWSADGQRFLWVEQVEPFDGANDGDALFVLHPDGELEHLRAPFALGFAAWLDDQHIFVGKRSTSYEGRWAILAIDGASLRVVVDERVDQQSVSFTRVGPLGPILRIDGEYAGDLSVFDRATSSWHAVGSVPDAYEARAGWVGEGSTGDLFWLESGSSRRKSRVLPVSMAGSSAPRDAALCRLDLDRRRSHAEFVGSAGPWMIWKLTERLDGVRAAERLGSPEIVACDTDTQTIRRWEIRVEDFHFVALDRSTLCWPGHEIDLGTETR